MSKVKEELDQDFGWMTSIDYLAALKAWQKRINKALDKRYGKNHGFSRGGFEQSPEFYSARIAFKRKIQGYSKASH